MQLITKHLSRDILNERYGIVQKDGICAFTGEKITEGVEKKKLIKPTFGDRQLIKFKSDMLSIDTAMLLAEIIEGNLSEKTGKVSWNALRTYNCFFTESEARIGMKNAEVFNLLFSIPETPFVLLATYSNKKHIAYFAKPQHSKTNFNIFTDKGVLFIKIDKLKFIAERVGQLYSEIPDKPEHTWFTKKEILNLHDANYSKTSTFGREKYRKILSDLRPYFGSHLYSFIVEFIPKNFKL